MTERERLTNLILSTPKKEIVIGGRAQGRTYQTAQNIADHLLANGVTVPPCKVGQTVYSVIISPSGVHNPFIEEYDVKGVLFANEKWFVLNKDGVTFEVGEQWCKLTREEAEKALAKMKGGAENCTTCAHMVSCEPNPFGTCKEYEERHDE